MSDFVYFVISGIVILFVPVLIISYFQAGFFTKWFKTRAGRGKYVLIKVRSKLRDYFDTGIIDGEYLIYGKKEKTKRLLVTDNSIYRSWGVACIDVDEATNEVCSINYLPSSAFDAEKFEGLYIRALYRPSLEENNMEKYILIAVGICIIICAITAFLVFDVHGRVQALANVGTITNVM